LKNYGSTDTIEEDSSRLNVEDNKDRNIS